MFVCQEKPERVKVSAASACLRFYHSERHGDDVVRERASVGPDRAAAYVMCDESGVRVVLDVAPAIDLSIQSGKIRHMWMIACYTSAATVYFTQGIAKPISHHHLSPVAQH